jgi:hypothetical protein
MTKFKALVSFSHDNGMYDPHVKEPYELDDKELLAAWAEAGYIEFVDEPKKATKKKGE